MKKLLLATIFIAFAAWVAFGAVSSDHFYNGSGEITGGSSLGAGDTLKIISADSADTVYQFPVGDYLHTLSAGIESWDSTYILTTNYYTSGATDTTTAGVEDTVCLSFGAVCTTYTQIEICSLSHEPRVGDTISTLNNGFVFDCAFNIDKLNQYPGDSTYDAASMTGESLYVFFLNTTDSVTVEESLLFVSDGAFFYPFADTTLGGWAATDMTRGLDIGLEYSCIILTMQRMPIGVKDGKTYIRGNTAVAIGSAADCP
jgi:hypothetical protein